MNLNFGEIVLLKFFFTDSVNFKKRPACVIDDSDDKYIIVCRVTSQIYNTQNDIFIKDWKESGLQLPSIIRVHKIATLQKSLVELIMGEINNATKQKVKNQFLKLIED